MLGLDNLGLKLRKLYCTYTDWPVDGSIWNDAVASTTGASVRLYLKNLSISKKITFEELSTVVTIIGFFVCFVWFCFFFFNCADWWCVRCVVVSLNWYHVSCYQISIPAKQRSDVAAIWENCLLFRSKYRLSTGYCHTLCPLTHFARILHTAATTLEDE